MNRIPKGFLKKYRKGKTGEILFLPLKQGYLRLEYDLYEGNDFLFLVSYVKTKSKNAIAIGNRLELSLSDDGNDQVTFMSEMGVSGLQWSNGEVIWGHTYDDDSSPPPGREVDLDTWIDECLISMISQ